MRNEISIRKCRKEDKSAGPQCSLGLFVATFFRQNYYDIKLKIPTTGIDISAFKKINQVFYRTKQLKAFVYQHRTDTSNISMRLQRKIHRHFYR